MASRRGTGRDLWAEITSHEEEQQQPQPKTQIAVVYGRRRAEPSNPRDVQIRSSKDNRLSFGPSKRTSWNRSLSIRGRESIVVAAGVNLRHQPNQRGAPRKPKQGQRAKKAGQVPPDFTKEKSYFQEVDSFELLEESPSPKHFGTWVMGTKQDTIVHDLPAILERWRISKLASKYGSSKPLFKIMETPLIPSGQSSNALIEKTPERASWSRVTLNFTSSQRSNTAQPADDSLSTDLNENGVLTSFDALHIKDEGNLSDIGEDVETRREGDVGEELEGPIKKHQAASRLTSLGGECLSAFTQLLMVCQQSAPVRLSDVFSTYCDPSSIVKIGEGTYGEAFKAGDTVCKIVPIDGDLLVNGEVQKKSEEVLEEVMLSLTLNSLRGRQGEANSENACTSFIESKDFRVCQGAYDAGLVSAWENWDAKHGSENDHPKEFSEEQCYIVFVLADGGKDLESFVLLNFDEARGLLVQVTAALAVAETACEFEHRDLHWGNILLTRNEVATMNFTLQGKKMSAKTFGLTASIIDFTLSRINTGEAILFLDLSADPGLFEGPKGDKQSETYRKMKEVTEEFWEGSFPKTNVLWLVYLVDLLLTKKSFKRAAKDERELRSFKKRLNSYESAKDSLSDPFFSDLLFDRLL
ncbi:serine/threonine-protein kinase haspin homolog isoform X2 [Phoenix dactylifera]|uniref:non-specific serine/threonine protein kinase n=1 Tax=Phoenix dactylifera TaxID=42345 RepID=A0A8B8ZUB4_PHODC|nr:serine/threonine-protein kinase haspin homolog isoform X2 [Phoenix dactylifera]